MELSVIVPVYNEGELLEKNILAVYSEAKKISKLFEIIISDDASRDSTSETGKALASRFKEIKYVRYNSGPSRRENMALAMKLAKGKIIAYLDSDLAVSPASISRLAAGIENGYDAVIGSRYVKGAVSERRLFRLVISKIYNFLIRAYFGSKVHDHQCGFKAFKRNAILKLIDELGYDNSMKRGWFWDSELLIRAQINKFRILELPVTWKYGKRSTFRLLREVRMIPYVAALRWRLKQHNKKHRD